MMDQNLEIDGFDMSTLKILDLDIFKAVVENEGYCLCALDKVEETKCPCKEFRSTAVVGEVCQCGLYEKVESFDISRVPSYPHGWSEKGEKYFG